MYLKDLHGIILKTIVSLLQTLTVPEHKIIAVIKALFTNWTEQCENLSIHTHNYFSFKTFFWSAKNTLKLIWWRYLFSKSCWCEIIINMSVAQTSCTDVNHKFYLQHFNYLNDFIFLGNTYINEKVRYTFWWTCVGENHILVVRYSELSFNVGMSFDQGLTWSLWPHLALICRPV